MLWEYVPRDNARTSGRGSARAPSGVHTQIGAQIGASTSAPNEGTEPGLLRDLGFTPLVSFPEAPTRRNAFVNFSLWVLRLPAAPRTAATATKLKSRPRC